MTSKLRTAATAAAISVGFLALSAGAAAAAPAHDWNGFYLGAHIYGEQAKPEVASFNETFNNFSGASVRNTGGTNTVFIVPSQLVTYAGGSDIAGGVYGGVQAGYSFSNSNWVFGVEGDLSTASQDSDLARSGSIAANILTPQSTLTMVRSVKLDWRWSARLRIGYAWERTQVYLTGGVAGGHVTVSGRDTFVSPGGAAPVTGCCNAVNTNAVTNVVAGEESSNATGWTAGAGAEWALSDKVTLGIEYRHTDLGEDAYVLPTTVVAGTVPTIITPAGSPGGGTAPNATLSTTTAGFKSDSIGMRLNFWF